VTPSVESSQVSLGIGKHFWHLLISSWLLKADKETKSNLCLRAPLIRQKSAREVARLKKYPKDLGI